MTAELIAKLNAKTQDLRLSPAGFDKLTEHDLSHALTFVHGRGPRLLGRVRYAEQDSFLAPLAYTLRRAVLQRARHEKWRNRGPIAKLSELAVAFYCRPTRCTKCDGIGHRYWGGKLKICPRCKDSKWEPITTSAIARAVGVSEEAIEDTWNKRLGVALEILGGWDRRCIAGVQRALFDKTPEK